MRLKHPSLPSNTSCTESYTQHYACSRFKEAPIRLIFSIIILLYDSAEAGLHALIFPAYFYPKLFEKSHPVSCYEEIAAFQHSRLTS